MKDRRFQRLFLGRTLGVLGGSYAPVALAFGVLALPNARPSTLSVVLAAESIPMVLFMLVGGVLADRFPRDRVIVAGNLLCAVGFLTTSALLISGWAPVWALATAAAVGGTGVAVFFPALMGIVPQVVPADRLQTANSVLGFGMNAARLLGAAIAGVTVALVGGGWALMGSALLFVASAALIIGLRLPRVVPGEAGPSMLHELRVGWREFASRQWLWVVVAQFSLLVMGLQAAFGVLGPWLAKHELGGAPAWAAVLAAESAGMMVGVVLAMRVRPSRPILVGVLMCLPGALPMALLGFSAPLWSVIAAAALMGICFDIFGVLWVTTMQREIPSETLSRVSAYDALGSLMFGPIGLLLAGPAVTWIGPKTAMLVCSGLVIVSTLAALAFPGVRNLRSPQGPAPDRELTPSPAHT